MTVAVDTRGTAVEQLADFVHGFDRASLPHEVAVSARQRVLDVLGLTAAAVHLATSRASTQVTVARGGAAEAVAVGVPERLPAASAAFVNGVLAHSLDYDDTHLPSVLHPSASVVPAVLATAEAVGADGAAVVAAVSTGLEVCVRLGMAGYDRQTGNSLFFEHGQHATSICGAVASAAAAARIRGLDATQIAHAMGIAVSMAGGVIEANRTGGTVKRMHCGWAARNGVEAAELAAAGVTGPPTVLEGRFGFFEAYLHRPGDMDALLGGLGTEWEVPGIFHKPYPANHFTHAGIDAAMALRRTGVEVADIEALELRVATATVRTIGDPIENKRRPETGYQAQFSGPYTVAAALLGGGGLGVAFEDFADHLVGDPDRQVLMDRVTVIGDERCDAIYPHQFPAVLSATLRDGSTVVEEVLVNRGGPDNPLTDGELAAKFDDNAGRALVAADVSSIRTACAGIDGLADVREMLAPLAGAGA